MNAQAKCLWPHWALPARFFLPFDSRLVFTVRAQDAKLTILSKRPMSPVSNATVSA